MVAVAGPMEAVPSEWVTSGVSEADAVAAPREDDTVMELADPVSVVLGAVLELLMDGT